MEGPVRSMWQAQRFVSCATVLLSVSSSISCANCALLLCALLCVFPYTQPSRQTLSPPDFRPHTQSETSTLAFSFLLQVLCSPHRDILAQEKGSDDSLLKICTLRSLSSDKAQWPRRWIRDAVQLPHELPTLH